MSNNPISEQLTFDKLLSKHKIEIPIIQRDYAQGREDKKEIRTTFLQALWEAVKGKSLELDFIYGSVKNDVLQPLDGQQRLTTLFLLYWYIAIKESKLADEVKKILIKFTYETRSSSREFCKDLIEKGITLNDGHCENLSELIIDSAWFFLSWKKDPTIKAMLIMLDAIHKKFRHTDNIWDKLGNISFHYIELQNFGLSDDLYIKMNARGKPLTDFENFKAKFEQLITENKWEENTTLIETFAFKIDTDWTGLFWNYRDKSKNIFDEQVMSFFKTLAKIHNALLGKDKDILGLDNLDEEYFKTLKAVLNKISGGENGVKKFLGDTTYANEEKLFEGAIKNDLGYADSVKLFTLYKYLILEENIEVDKLKNWMRIIRNLVEGSRPYLFNNPKDFSNALRSVKELLEHRNTIDEHFARMEKDSLSGFIKSQVVEEKLKSKLILQSNVWKEVIIETENHGYFKGQIGFLLDWCKDESGQENIEKFQEYKEKAEAIFKDNGLVDFKDEDLLFERAMLATGNYLLKKGKNHSFLIDKERDISWKRLLRDKNEKRAVLQRLLDKLPNIPLAEDLQKIINAFFDKNDWRYCFIKYPEMIKACGNKKLIRWFSEFNILLLGSTTTSGYHKEYYSYSLYVELKELKGISYHRQRSVNRRKYLKLKDKRVAFDPKIKKFIWTTDNDENWQNQKEFENRDNAIAELINHT